MAGASVFSRFAGSGATALMLVALVLVGCCAAPASAERLRQFFGGVPTTWRTPVGAYNMSVSIWGAGGGASGTGLCSAGGGSGSAVMNRPIGNANNWGIPASQIQWTMDIGLGGAGYRGSYQLGLVYAQAGDGGASTIVAKASNGTVLFRASAYGGGGALAMWNNRTGCWGGAGGGASSSAVGRIPGGGIPSGGADNNATGPPAEGGMVGDVKAGGAGAGFGYVDGDLSNPYLHGAAWTSPGVHHDGGWGFSGQDPTFGFGFARGGAAGFYGAGGGAQTQSTINYPPDNSGSGGGSRAAYPDLRHQENDNAPGADGGVVIEFSLRMPPTIMFKSSTASKFLTAHSYGGVTANVTWAQTWERWTSVPLANGKYAFRSWQYKYLKANPTNSVEATATVIDTWEQFEPIEINFRTGRWLFKTHHGTYLSAAADGFVYCGTDPRHFWTIYDTV